MAPKEPKSTSSSSAAASETNASSSSIEALKKKLQQQSEQKRKRESESSGEHLAAYIEPTVRTKRSKATSILRDAWRAKSSPLKPPAKFLLWPAPTPDISSTSATEYYLRRTPTFSRPS